MEMIIAQYVMQFAAAHPILLSIFAAMGAARLIMKPLFTFLHSAAAATATTADDKIVDEVEQSGVVTAIYYALDLLFSLKLIK